MTRDTAPFIAVVGAGPAGLMAAERLAAAGCRVAVFERMARPARKFLLAGRGGLNLTNTAALEHFLTAYGDTGAADVVRRAVRSFPPAELQQWCASLGIETFEGSSGRIFPVALKASPLLRAWLRRLAAAGVTFRMGQCWTGWTEDGHLTFLREPGSGEPGGPAEAVAVDATVLALGGASWPRLGSRGDWLDIVARRDVPIVPFAPSNAGVTIDWSAMLVARFTGTPLKRVTVSCAGARHTGEVVVTERGLEGGPIYALGPQLRASLAGSLGAASIKIDLRPDLDVDALARRIAAQPAKASLATALRKATGLTPAAIAMLREPVLPPLVRDPVALAHAIKCVRLPVIGLSDIERAISTVGGVSAEALDERLMLRAAPGVFAAGEMIDWDAPTGGYLLQACLATGRVAAEGVIDWLAETGRVPVLRPINEPVDATQ